MNINQDLDIPKEYEYKSRPRHPKKYEYKSINQDLDIPKEYEYKSINQ